MTSEETSAHVASVASRCLDQSASLTLSEIRMVCGSALTQTEGSNLANALAGGTASERVAWIAARGLQYPALLTGEEIRTVCGSVLTQAPTNEPAPTKEAVWPAGAYAFYNRLWR